MEIRLIDDARSFMEIAGPLLLEDEARNNLICGIAGTLIADPSRYAEKRFWVALEDGQPAAAALRTPPYNLVLARPRDGGALEALVRGIDEELPGVVGAHPEVDLFAELWTSRRGVVADVLRNQGVYALERVNPVPRPPGSARAAGPTDAGLLTDWMLAFAEEVLEPSDPGRTEAKQAVEHRLRGGEDGGFWIWEDEGEPASMSGWGGPTPNGIRIGPVYTPPKLRGRGYATALVAGQSQWLVDSGRSFCFLFTDLANPVSNAIYERIGYVRVAESAMVSFRKRNR